MEDEQMTDRSDLVRAIHVAGSGTALAQAVAALDDFDKQRRAALEHDRETDLGAQLVARRLDPVPLHEHHTAATDWLSEYQEPAADFRTAMIAEASTWYRGLDPAVRADAGELAEQARGRARTLASAYASRAPQAAGEFLQVVGYLHAREGASGLPQIDQTIDPNNQQAPTPYPVEVFPTFGAEQDPYNGTESNNHQSGASSQGAPLLQQVQQQNGSGSGYGTGPEKPDSHTTQMDQSGSYAEVPLGTPGQIPTVPAPTDSMMESSHPNPVAGTDQDAGADRRQALGHVEGWSMPDAFGYRWATGPEVTSPFHERCASFHWAEEACGTSLHTASVAIGYTTDLDVMRRVASCEETGARAGLNAFRASRSLAELTAVHNRVAAGWGASDRTMEDTAVLHGFMAVVRPAMADLAVEARDFSKKEREKAAQQGDALPDGKLPIKSKQDLKNAEKLKGKVKGDSKAKVDAYMREKEKEFGKAASAGRAPNFT